MGKSEFRLRTGRGRHFWRDTDSMEVERLWHNCSGGLLRNIRGRLRSCHIYIDNYEFADGEPLNIVAHSHGGNVVKIATYFLNRNIDNLVNLGTPENFDLPDINSRAVNNYCSVSSVTDLIQVSG